MTMMLGFPADPSISVVPGIRTQQYGSAERKGALHGFGEVGNAWSIERTARSERIL
jgi:hypothetical protein